MIFHVVSPKPVFIEYNMCKSRERVILMKKFFILILALLMLLPPVTVFAQSNDRFQIGGDIIIDSQEEILGDVVAVFGNVTVNGKVAGDVVAIFGDVRVNGEVMGDVTAVGGNILRGETSKIHGRSTAIGALGINGLIDGIKRRSWHLAPGGFRRNIRFSFFRLVRFLGHLGVGTLIIILFPNAIKRAADFVGREIGRQLLVGLAILLLTPFAVIFMFVTLIGIPLIPVLLMLVYAAAFFGYLCVSIYIGRQLTHWIAKKPGLLMEFVLGALILWVIQSLPFVGSLTAFIVLIISLGIAAGTQFGTKTD